MWKSGGKFLTTPNAQAKVKRSESVSPDRANKATFSRRTSSFRNSFRRQPADFSDIQHLTELKGGIQLSDKQKLLIRQFWADVNSKEKLPGQWVLRRLFTGYPEIRNVFGIDESRLSDLESVPIFLRHSQVFQNLLEMTVASLDALDDQLGPLLYSYGCRHVAFERQNGFSPEMWQNFADVMCEMPKKMRRGANTYETAMAWRLLVLFVTAKVRSGFEAEKREKAGLSR